MEMSHFKDKLKILIKKNGYTQEQFADEVGIGASTLRTYLSKKNNTLPDLLLLSKMCKILNCDIGFLVGDYDYLTHYRKFFSVKLGLDEESYDLLEKIYDSEGGDDLIYSLNAIIKTPEFKEILLYISNLRYVNSNDPNLAAIITNPIYDITDYEGIQKYKAYNAFVKMINNVQEIPVSEKIVLTAYLVKYQKHFDKSFPIQNYNSYSKMIECIKECLSNNFPLDEQLA